MFFMIGGSNRLVRRCNEKSRPQEREIAENLREFHVMNNGVNYQRQSMNLVLNFMNSQGPGTTKTKA